MNKSSYKRLLVPGILFLIFVLIALNTEDVLQQFGFAAIGQTQKVFDYGFRIGLWISAAFFLNRLIIVFFWDGLIAHAIKGTVPRLLKDITGFILYVIAATGIMAVVFNKPVTGFWATSGVLGVVLGFALRNIILDIFTGLAVNVDRPYSIGDWIMIVDNPGEDGGNLIGRVEEINWRTTRLKTTSNNMLVVPNNIMGQKVITNFMAPGEQSRFELDFTLDFSVPSERAIRILTAAVLAVADERDGPLSDPAPKARITGISDLGVKYRLRYWIIPRFVSPARARHTVITSVLNHLHQGGLALAYPKQDTYVAALPKRQLEHGLIEDRSELLARIAWFVALTKDEFRQLAESINTRRFVRGDVVLREGETGQSMFVVVEGLMEMSVNSDGKDVKVGKLSPSDFYGEMSLLTGESRTATVTASTDVVAYEIRKEHLSPILAARPEVGEAISQIVAERQVARQRALAEVTDGEPEKQTAGLAAMIFSKMKRFFRDVFGEDESPGGVPLRERYSSST